MLATMTKINTPKNFKGKRSTKIIYARGFPSGAPLAMIRGGGLREPGVVEFLKGESFRWDERRHAWTSYLHAPELVKILEILDEEFGLTIVAKNTMDASYILPEFPEVQS